MSFLAVLLGWIGIAVSFLTILFPFSIYVDTPKGNTKEFIFYLIFFGVNFSVIGFVLLKSKIILNSISAFFVTVGTSVVLGGIIPLIALGRGLDSDYIAFLVPSFLFTGGAGMLFIGSHINKKVSM